MNFVLCEASVHTISQGLLTRNVDHISLIKPLSDEVVGDLGSREVEAKSISKSTWAADEA
jgi:hypothetical protein